MEYCKGIDLLTLIIRNKTIFTEEKAMVVMRCLFKAINHCHFNNIVHRDVKPENVIYDEEAHPMECIKIIDFGLSKQ